MEPFPREVQRHLPETVLFICRDDRGRVIVADEVDPGTAISLARGWAEMGFHVQVKVPLSLQQRRVMLAANPPTRSHPSEYRPNPALLNPGSPGTWMAPFGDRVASEYEKTTARNDFHYAVMHGKIERLTSCQKCGADEGEKDGLGALDAHHEDYAEPLDVVYLCRSCHRRRHRLRNRSVPVEDWLLRPSDDRPEAEALMEPPVSGDAKADVGDQLTCPPFSGGWMKLRLPFGVFTIGRLTSVRSFPDGHYELKVTRAGGRKRPTTDVIAAYPTTFHGEPSKVSPALAWISSAVDEEVVVQLRHPPKAKKGRLFFTAEQVWLLADVKQP